MFWKQHLKTLCGYQSYGSCWISLASEWGWRGGAEVDGKQICSSHLSFRCVHPSAPPGPSSLALPTGCVCLMLCRASSKTSQATESLLMCCFTQRLPEDLPNTYTGMYVSWIWYLEEIPQEFRHVCDCIAPVTYCMWLCSNYKEKTNSLSTAG